jgi:hypothetical protein
MLREVNYDVLQMLLAKGELEKSIKFFEKSLRLYPLPGMMVNYRDGKTS